MKNKFNSLIKIGIIGGGQLGRMMTQKAKKMGFYVEVLDPTPNSPAAQVADKQIVGDFYDEEKIKQLVGDCDVITYDIEHINTRILKELFDDGHKIYPSPYLLEIINDKFKQKEILYRNGLPVPKYKEVNEIKFDVFKEFGFPLVQKAKKGGYDGKGVVILKDERDFEKALKTESMLEELVDIDKELAVMVARNIKGEVKCYPVVEMTFDERANICDMVIVPAAIDKDLEEQAKEIAVKSIEVLDGVGIFGVEMFLTKDRKILINEIAPRPHNSGHYTIEACMTCQFEQHIRAITGLPLGSTKLLSPAVMVNLFGDEDSESGHPAIEGLEEILSIEGVSFHFYGKKLVKPFRKMGHVTILNDNLDKVLGIAKQVKNILKIKSEQR